VLTFRCIARTESDHVKWCVLTHCFGQCVAADTASAHPRQRTWETPPGPCTCYV